MGWKWLDNIKELIGEPMSSTGPHVNWEYILNNITGTGNSTIGTDTGSEYLPTGGSGIYKCTGDEVTITTTYNLYISNSVSGTTAHYRLGTSSNTGRYVNASWRPNSGSVNYISFRFAINNETEEAVIIYLCSSTASLVVAYEKCSQAWARKELYTILTAHINTGATIRVNYYLPDCDYTYAKITYKQDSEPASETDGESVEILKDETSVNIEGLEEDKTYYFKIFTDKSESEAFEYTVEVDPVPPEYKTYIDNINGTGFDWIRKLEQDTATITNSDRSTFTADMYKYYPMNKVTWYTHSHQGTDVENWNKTTFAGQTTALFVSSKIDKVEINSNNNVYSCTITKNNENSVTSPDRMFVYDKTITMGGVYTKDTLPRGWYANFNYHSGYLAYGPNCNPFYLAGSWATRTFSGTLTEVFEQLQRYVRNIDIYVDGVLWSKAGK